VTGSNNVLIDIGGLAGSESLIPAQKPQAGAPFTLKGPPQIQKAAPATVDLLADMDVFKSVIKPTQIVKSEEAIIHDKNGLQIKLVMTISDTVVNAKAILMNVTPVNFKDVKFLVSTPKVLFSAFI
jgi:hypothetical protein